MERHIGLLSGLLLLLGTACGDSGSGGAGGDAGDTTTTQASSVAASSTRSASSTANASASDTTATGSADPQVELTVDPAVVAPGGTITATVVVQGFVLEAPEGQPNEPGHGHFHIYLDDATGTSYLLAGETGTVDLQIPANTPAGPHTLRINLGQNDHAPLVPAVEDVVDIVVQ